MPQHALVNQLLTDRQMQDLDTRLGSMLSTCLGLGYPPAGVSVSDWFLLSDDPVLEAGAFYARLKNETLFEFADELNAPQKRYLLEQLIKHGVNVVDWLLQGVQSPFFVSNQITLCVPPIPFDTYVSSSDHRATQSQFFECVKVLDALWGAALLVPCFAPDLDNRRGLPRVYSNQHLGVPLNDPQARLFALVLTDPDNLAYISQSPLMQACMARYFDELSNQQSPYPRHALIHCVEAFSSMQKRMIAEPLKTAFADLYGSLTKGFEQLHFAAQDLPASLESSLSASQFTRPDLRTDLFQMPIAQHLEIAISILRTRVFQPSCEVMQALFYEPDAFCSALFSSKTSEETANKLFAHCLGVKVLAMGECADPQHFHTVIDEFRAAFTAWGYSDIKGTAALDALAINLNLAEYFIDFGYMRCEEMNLGRLFCQYPFIVRDPYTNKADSRTKLKIMLASDLKQIQTLKKAALCFLNPADGASETPDLASAYSVQILLHYAHVQPSELIDRQLIFEKILAMGFVTVEELLEDPALARFAELGLQHDIGL